VRIGRRIAVTTLALSLLPLGASASDFVDTRLTFIFGDDNFLAKAGETNPSSPDAGFGRRPGRIFFFDTLNSRFQGDETLTNLVLYKKFPGFIPGLTTEAAFVAMFQILGDPRNERFADNGSYLKITYDFEGGEKRNKNLVVTLFPFDAPQFRLGYHWDVSWGQGEIFPRATGTVPGAKIQLDMPTWYIFGGAKTSQIRGKETPRGNEEAETFYGFLGGGGWDITSNIRLEASGGYFQKGRNPLAPVEGRIIDSGGVSAQLVLHDGIPIVTPIDFRLYKQDPTVMYNMAWREVYGSGFSWNFSAELTSLWQSLSDPDRFGSTKVQNAKAAYFELKTKFDYFRVNLSFVYRDLEFLLFNVPSFVPFEALPAQNVEVTPEFFGAVAFDYHFKKAHLTPGFVFGFQRPASVTAELSGRAVGSNPPGSLSGRRTVVVRRQGSFDILPENAAPTMIYAMKALLRWDLSDIMTVVGEFVFAIDNNTTLLQDDPSGIARRLFQRPEKLGFNIIAQARF
jgi:hypothetical protein